MRNYNEEYKKLVEEVKEVQLKMDALKKELYDNAPLRRK